MRLYAHVRRISQMLHEAGVDSPGLCARLLVAHAAGLDKTSLTLKSGLELPEKAEQNLNALADRRARGEPLAYILGKKEFYEHEFLVSSGTLVPRPETELLVDAALESCASQTIIFMDAGCGTGCIGLSLLARRPSWRGILLDNSVQAMRMARANTRRIAPRAILLRSDIFHLPLKPASLDLVIANLPYIKPGDPDTMAEVLAFEPHCALFSGQDGLGHIAGLVGQAANILKPGGVIILEHGSHQGSRVLAILANAGFASCNDLVDLAGLPRCAVAVKP